MTPMSGALRGMPRSVRAVVRAVESGRKPVRLRSIHNENFRYLPEGTLRARQFM
jgi:hypothetical protein